METKEYKLLDGRTIRAKYDKLGMCKISQENLEAFLKEFNASYRQAKILETIKKNYALMKVNERKKGKWIEERDDYGNITGWHCSNCYDKTGFVTTCAWDYCPNCGAEMESDT